ncbi:unnamed protein product [Echinostoma caproni]|uniref:Cadherin n=1 Tax=Echinostoma caproni TaxID=27848 RepID=A0A183AF39_9TREM|nr:unnamed protein product [Echinostoma caproni]
MKFNLACQSFATIEVSEYSANPRKYEPPGLVNEYHFPVPGGALFSTNLTDLLVKHLHLTESDLNTSIFFADAEQSRPFVIQARPFRKDRNESSSNRRWYQLVSTVPLDREQLCSFALQPERVQLASTCCSKSFDLPADVVMATINQPCCIFLGITISTKGTHVLRIQIIDVNDNAPRFNVQLRATNDLPYFANILGKNVIGISESVPPGSWIPIPAAIDNDEGPNGAVRYVLEPLSENLLWTEYFRLINNIRAAGLHANSTSAPFMINDQRKSKSFEPNDYTGPGLLILHPLDREKISSFGFRLVANDLGIPVQLSSSVNIRIVVLDENDNAPTFEKSDYQVQIRENQAGVSLVHAKVQDADVDNNGRLSYFMQPTRLDPTMPATSAVSADFLRTHIQLVPVNDGVTLRVSQPLDYEKQPEFTFDLIAVDHGQPPLSATAHVHVSVINVNDYPPMIRFYYHGEPLDRDYARLSVLEQHDSSTSVDNQLICHVHVTDADSDFESISCTVESTERNFFLREVTTNRLIQRSKIYELLTTTKLDREGNARLLILVRCQDGKMANSLASQNQLQLILLDVNDHAPVFTQDHYHGVVPENAANTLVSFSDSGLPSPGQSPTNDVHARDADSGMNALIFYSIVPWSISSSDSDESDSDKSKNSINTTRSTAVQPDRLTNTKSSNSSNHTFLHNPREDAEKFYIDQTTGQIRTRVALDCEEQQIYRFLVLAIDQAEQLSSRYTATAKVTVTVRDENDNPPVIEQRHYTFAVREGLPRHTRIGQIQSVDADIGSENRRTVYELKNVENFNGSEFILIEAHTGYVRTRQVLDREVTSQISFIVLARNEQPVEEVFRGKQTIQTEKGPTFFDEVSVTVTVEDENDNVPILVRRVPPTLARLLTRELAPSVIDLTFRLSTNETSSPCIEFPYEFVDDDEGPNGEIEVLLENNNFFEFRLDNSLLCKTTGEQPTMGQMNLFITLQDKPVDKTKTLKRQYTIRVRFIEDISPATEARPFERLLASRFTSNPTLLPAADLIESTVLTKQHGGAERKPKANDQRQTFQDVPKRDPRGQKPLASSATVTIVAILVAVSGLLCLLLLGVVFALRKATPNGQNNSADFNAKPRDDEDGENSMLSGQRGDAHRICFATSQSPSSYQTSTSTDRFRPVTQTYMWTKGSLDRQVTKSPHTADVNRMYTPSLHLLNNQVKSWTSAIAATPREFLYRPGYQVEVLGQQGDPNYERCEDQRDPIAYGKSNYSTLDVKLMPETPVSDRCDGRQKSKFEIYGSRIVDPTHLSHEEGLEVLSLTKPAFYRKSKGDMTVNAPERSELMNENSMENSNNNGVEMCSRLPLSAVTVSEYQHDNMVPRSVLKRDPSLDKHNLAENSESTKSPKQVYAQTSFV